MKQIVKTYLPESVLDAARERVAWVFDRFERVNVSVSGGKDSTVLFHLAVDEAARRGRKVTLFFLDQEAEYEGTIALMRTMMAHPAVTPAWYQVPIRMTNATSYADDQLFAWGPGEPWMREKEPTSIHYIDGDYPARFYPFFEWLEERTPDTAFLVGLRAEEGINRFRAVVKNPGVDGVPWTSRTGNASSFKAYPLYDWGMGDVWRYIAATRAPYNRIYDLRWAMNGGVYNDNRVSNLIHEMSFRCLPDLAALEPDTYARLVKRLKGVHCAAHHAQGAHLYDVQKLPAGFASWLAYRTHLLATMPIDAKKRARFEKRFAGQPSTEPVHHAQCKQLLVNDYENSIPVPKSKTRPVDRFARWRTLF